MPKRLHETRNRYFEARALHGAPLPPDRFVFLELLDVDVAAGVARFSYELVDPGSELWVATVPGFRLRPAVREAVKEAVFAELVEGGEFEIPLSPQPQLTQLEVRFAEPASVTVYRIETRGVDARTFRYVTEQDPGERLDAERLAWRLEDGELRGFELGSALPNGEWEFDGDEIAFDTDPVAAPARQTFALGRVFIYGEAS